MDHEDAWTVLFCHGAGFCKQVWDPIVQYLSHILPASLKMEMIAFDMPYHGQSAHDIHAHEQTEIDTSTTKSARVFHPVCNDWVELATDAVIAKVQELQTKRQQPRRLIGIGHSMGATGLWTAEMRMPGTFAGLILFEPTFVLHHLPGFREQLTNVLVHATLQRPWTWASYEAVEAFFKANRTYASWDPTVLAAYLNGAILRVQENGRAYYRLACHPRIEAAIYTGSPPDYTDSELVQPKCKIHFHTGARTRMMQAAYYERLMQANPDIYHSGRPIADTTHLMVMEKPMEAAQAIANDLQTYFVSIREPQPCP